MWTQNLDPAGQPWVSALAASLPVIFMFWALAVRRMAGHVAAVLTAALALAVAVVVFRMPPRLALLAAVHGAAYGLFPIGWIVVAAVFLYHVTDRGGQFAVIKASIAGLTADRRLQALLIAFSFGAFLEGAAGFGTPVAISAAMLAELGFTPIYAAGLCLVANTAPVAFGAIGTPVIVAAQVSGLPELALAQMIGRQLPLLSLLVPAYLVALMAGWRGVREVWPAVLVSGGTFAVAQAVTSNLLGPMLPDIVSAVCSIVALVLLLRVWRPATVFRFEEEPAGGAGVHVLPGGRAMLVAWAPFLALTALVGAWGLPAVKAALDTASLRVEVPGLDQAIISATNGAPVRAVYTLNCLSAVGTAILVASFVAVAAARMSPREAARVFAETLRTLARPLVTMAAVLGFAYLGNASGMMTTIGVALSQTGAIFPLVSPMLGWLGVFVTGSDTSANAVFGKLQAVTAERLGLDPVLTVAANSSGGVTGKMISPQSIAVACAATGLVGREADLFRYTVRHSLVFAAALCALTLLQATVLHWMVP